MIEIGMSKKDKELLEAKVNAINTNLDILTEGDPSKVFLKFSSLKSAVENLLPEEEKAILQIRKDTVRHKNKAVQASVEVEQIKERLFSLKNESF